MHEFIVVCLKKLLNESGRKQVALKAAAKTILGALLRDERKKSHCLTRSNQLGDIEAPGCVLTVTKDDSNEVVYDLFFFFFFFFFFFLS
jgi:hypothetical protein